jgi:hypothetical protein
MKLTFDVHLNWKNGLSIVIGICVILLAVIPLKVDAAHIGWMRWQVGMYGLATIAMVALFLQAAIQSKEDHEREIRESARDESLVRIEEQVADLVEQSKTGKPKPQIIESAPSEPQGELSKAQTPAPPQDIDGEVYRLVLSPRSVAWGLVRDIFRATGREDAVVDTDILVEMYLVNRDKTKTRYVRDLRLSAEVDGERVDFKRQADLMADDFNDTEFEYGLKDGIGETVKPINALTHNFPMALAPEQPVEGWVRFMANAINADKVAQGTIVLIAIDSLGNEYPITKAAASRQSSGEIGLRRFRG